ncbi:hypothetical protein RHGRI_038132 [Rhododendron griersonianum]|uniref:Uncharacterized protein n=1 Tax=Rhododendron griersonianum TaxID=479676 RepID=A0AAV6I026_9ERIC|nr:hypothetical protein RHGRI_038132 [Rhododendron griersonianum]
MKSHVQLSSHTTQTLIPFHKPFVYTSGAAFPPPPPKPAWRQIRINKLIKSKSFPGSIKAIATSDEKSTTVKAVVTVKVIAGGILSPLGLAGGHDKNTDLFGKSILLELVSAELDPKN